MTKFKKELQINLIEQNNQILASSRDIADKLEKEHKDVCNKIREVLEISENFRASNFKIIKSFYRDILNREQVEYLVSKDAFILLLMNYTGFNEFKINYINAFNSMEQELQKRQQKQLLKFDNKSLLKLKELLNNIECTLTFNDLIDISHKKNVNEVCQYLTAKSLTQRGNIANLIKTINNQSSFNKLLR